jgi:hypothetical protein
VIVGIIVAVVWSLVLGIIIALIGLIAFGGSEVGVPTRSGVSNGFSRPSGRPENRRSGTSICCSRTARGASCPQASATRSGRLPAGAPPRFGRTTRRRSTSTGNAICSSSALLTVCWEDLSAV